MEQQLTRLWYGETAAGARAPLSWLVVPLLPFSVLYRAAMAIRRQAYARGWLRSHRVGRPVLVVGNLTVGGTGKTPLVAWLAQRLAARGFWVGIVSRGYGRSDTAPRIVEPNADWREVGDEPLLLRRGTGCLTIVAADRVAAARALVERGVDLIIADDGLQHLRLARECEIVVVDGARGFGSGRVLPAGPLREPISRLESVDLVVFNGSAGHSSLAKPRRSLDAHRVVEMSLALGDAMPVGGTAQPQSLESFRGQRVHAVAGIGNPWRFFRDLRARGIEVIAHPFPDHHAFSAADLQFDDELPVLMTEKDAVKCRALADPRLWYIPVAAQLSEAQARELLDCVTRKLGLSSSTRG